MLDAGLVAADEEVKHVDVVDVRVAVVEINVDVPGRLFHVEVQEMSMLEEFDALGVADRDGNSCIDGVLADRCAVDLALLAC